MNDMELWLVEHRANTRRELNELALQESLQEAPARSLEDYSNLLKLDFLLLEMEADLGMMDGIKLW